MSRFNPTRGSTPRHRLLIWYVHVPPSFDTWNSWRLAAIEADQHANRGRVRIYEIAKTVQSLAGAIELITGGLFFSLFHFLFSFFLPYSSLLLPFPSYCFFSACFFYLTHALTHSITFLLFIERTASKKWRA